ncbi:heme-binding protein [Streptomyces thermospinosisporus]|uniref:Heme-binding protein n=1 Tax=Streptomyces thermospinosisporus TaxID=161482 RepID=A0ABN1YYT4_9ACTN
MSLTLAQAQQIVQAGIDFARDEKPEPLTFAVLDPGGTLVTLAREDGAGLLRPDIAVAKAWGVLGLGIDNREIGRRAAAAPEFFTSVAALAGGRILSVPGGVFVRDEQGRLLGAVGATGDTSPNDERAAVAGIRAVGLVPETGADEPAD